MELNNSTSDISTTCFKMAFGIHIYFVICNLINISMSQNTGLHKTSNSDVQLSEMFAQMQALVRTMNGFIPEIMNNLEELKSAFNAQFNSKMNESSTYTFHYQEKNWMDADLSCKAGVNILCPLKLWRSKTMCLR